MNEQAQTEQTVNQEASNFTIPEAYASKGWAKDIKSADDLWKLTDNAQSLIGKRPAGIPANDAPDAEWEKFYAAAGRPDKPDAYKFSDIEGLPEGVDIAPFKSKASEVLHAAGLNQKQADKVWQMFMKAEMEAATGNKKAMTDSQAALDKQFDDLVKEHFGDKFEQAQNTALEFINQKVPEGLRSAYTEIADNPKALVAVISAVNAAQSEVEKIKKEYGVEGKLTSGEGASPVAIEDVRKELATLRTSQAAKDFTHADHKKTMEQINELSGKVAAYYNK